MGNADDIVFCANDYEEVKENDEIRFFFLEFVIEINSYGHIVLVFFPILPLSLFLFDEIINTNNLESEI